MRYGKQMTILEVNQIKIIINPKPYHPHLLALEKINH